MPRLYQRKPKKAGSPPGSLVAPDIPQVTPSRIHIIDYGKDHIEELEPAKIEAILPYKNKSSTTWINIDGIHDTGLIEQVGQHFDIHPLILEDIVHAHQRPKAEVYDEVVYMVLRMLTYAPDSHDIRSEQVSILLGKGYLISFQERQGDIFDPVRERIRKGNLRIRKNGAGYLAYALLDAIVDHYFVVLEQLGERIEEIEEDIIKDSSQELLLSIIRTRKDLIYLRKSVWPVRELIGVLQRSDTPFFTANTGIYLRDIYDHTIQVIDTLESFRDMSSGLMDTHLSITSNKMNEVMKMLTIIATIFIPLTFIAGVYGMNFEVMPELTWRYSYFVVWGLMILIGTAMVVYFRNKKWL